MSTQSPRTVDELIERLGSGDAWTRLRAAVDLSKMGKDGITALPALLVALEDTDFFVVFGACGAIKQIASEAPTVLPMLKEFDTRVGSRNPAVAAKIHMTILAIETPPEHAKRTWARRIVGFLQCLLFVGAAILLGVWIVRHGLLHLLGKRRGRERTDRTKENEGTENEGTEYSMKGGDRQ